MLKGIWKSGANLDSSRLRRGTGLLGHVTLIRPDIRVVKLGCIAGLLLDLFGNFPAGVDLVALVGAEDGIEAALFDSVLAFQP